MAVACVIAERGMAQIVSMVEEVDARLPVDEDGVGEDRAEERPIGLEPVHLQRAQRTGEASDRRSAARRRAPSSSPPTSRRTR